MKLSVRLFAAARQLAGTERVEVLLREGSSVAELREQLVVLYPALEPIVPQAAFAVNEAYASDSTKLAEQDDIACIPPVSGG